MTSRILSIDGARLAPLDNLLDGQIGWWLERNAANSSVINLMNPGTFDGTLKAGVDWSEGAKSEGQVLQFDGGTNAYIDLGTDPLIHKDTPFTLMWIERADTSSGYRGLFTFCPSGTTQRFIVFRNDSDTTYRYLTSTISNNGGSIRFAGAPTLASGAGIWRVWMLFGAAGMGSLSAVDWSLAVDGASFAASTGNTISSFTGALNYIGWDSLDDKWLGALANVRLWGRVLSAGERARLLLDPFAGLDEDDQDFIPSTVAAFRRDRMFAAM